MMTGAVSPVFRMPYKALTLSQREEGLKILAEISQADRVGEQLNLMADNDFYYSY